MSQVIVNTQKDSEKEVEQPPEKDEQEQETSCDCKKYTLIFNFN